MFTQSQKGNAAIIAVVVVLIVGGAWFLFMKDRDDGQTGPEPMVSPTVTVSPTESSPTPTPTPTTTPVSGSAVPGVKEFKVSGSPFKFDPIEIKVKKGDTVRIVFTNQQGTHDWVVDEFNARTKILQSGQSETIEFVVNKTGTFEYYCSVGTHRQMGMVGNLIVE